MFDASAVPALINATQYFQTYNTDPKAQVILTLNSIAGGPGAILLSFYDGPNRPAAFAPFNGIQPTLSTLASQSFYSFATSTNSDLEAGNRGAFNTLSTTGTTPGFLAAVYNETQYYGSLALLNSGLLISYDVEPFMNYGQHATDSAFPHANSPLPLNLYFSWSLAADDSFWLAAIAQSIAHLTEVAKTEGIYSKDLYAYPNYAVSTLSSQQLYGASNLARLRKIQNQVDPNRVMELAGGFTL